LEEPAINERITLKWILWKRNGGNGLNCGGSVGDMRWDLENAVINIRVL